MVGVRAATLGWYLLVALFTVPLWWKLTEVYRADIPFHMLNAFSLQFAETLPRAPAMTVAVVACGSLERDSSAKAALDAFAQKLKTTLNGRESNAVTWSGSQVAGLSVDWNAQVVTSAAAASFGDEVFGSSSRDATDDALLPAAQAVSSSHGAQYALFLFSASTCTKELRMGAHRHGWACIDKNSQNGNFELAQKVVNSLSPMWTAERDGSGSVPLSSKLRLTFTLLNEAPQEMTLRWDLAAAADRWLKPTLDRIRALVDIEIGSQVLRYTALRDDILHVDASSNGRYIKAESLTHVIDPDWIIDPSASTTQALNFLYLVPSAKHAPLAIRDNNGNDVPCRCFSQPRSGGVVVAQGDLASASSGGDDKNNSKHGSNGGVGLSGGAMTLTVADLKPVMSTFLAQLIRDMGITVGSRDDGTVMVPQWAIDTAMRSITRRRAAAAFHSLSTLDTLIQQIPVLVVGDAIERPVVTGIDGLTTLRASWSQGHFESACQAASMALTHSETAFFNEGILSMLYFPEDHKMAVYIPFFLPFIMVMLRPVLEHAKKVKERKKNVVASAK